MFKVMSTIISGKGLCFGILGAFMLWKFNPQMWAFSKHIEIDGNGHPAFRRDRRDYYKQVKRSRFGFVCLVIGYILQFLGLMLLN